MQLDRRRQAFRADLAAEYLRGHVEAARFAAGTVCQVIRESIGLRRQAGDATGYETELLFGEHVTMFDAADGWAWVQSRNDDYVGYVPASALSDHVLEPSHRVSAIGTFVYADADIKSPPQMHLALNSRLTVVATTDRFSRLAQGGFVVSRHIAPIDRFARDFVEIGERLLGTPYLWGGRTRLGIDCSGLVQSAMQAAGIRCPRDSDMQRAEVGVELPVPSPQVIDPATLDAAGLARGDLVFWPGHVGIMSDGVMLLHANAHHMAVVIEPLVTAAQRIARAGSEIVALKRPATLGALSS